MFLVISPSSEICHNELTENIYHTVFIEKSSGSHLDHNEVHNHSNSNSENHDCDHGSSEDKHCGTCCTCTCHSPILLQLKISNNKLATFSNISNSDNHSILNGIANSIYRPPKNV